MPDPNQPKPSVMLIPVYDRPINRGRFVWRAELDDIERARNFVAWMHGQGVHHVSLEQFFVVAIRDHATLMEQRYNGGQPFPPRDGDLKGGRRPGVHGKSPTVPIAGEESKP